MLKLLQSFWLNKNLSGGWLSAKFHLMGWALSSFSIHKHQSSPHLITTEQGADLLLGQLQLPYASVSLAFQTFQNPYPDYWVLKKLLAYSLQDAPFLHIDGDAFLFKPLPSQLFTAPLVAQNYEYNHPYYLHAFDQVQSFGYLPSYLKPEPNGRISGVNAGVMGGHNTLFFRDLYAEVLSFLNQNQQQIPTVNNEDFNIFLEQFFFRQYATHRQEKVAYILAEEYGYPCQYGLDRFQDIPNLCGYLHLMNYKRNPTACEQMAQRLYIESPELYERCERVARNLATTHHAVLQPKRLEYEGAYRSASLPITIPAEVMADVVQYEQEKKAWIESLPPVAELWRHWRVYSVQVNALLSQPDQLLAQQSIRHSSYLKRLCSEWNWAEINEFVSQDREANWSANANQTAAYYEVGLYLYLHEGVVKEQLLDAVGILLLDNFEEAQPLGTGIEAVWQQIKTHQPTAEERAFKVSLMSQVRFYLYQGVLEPK